MFLFVTSEERNVEDQSHGKEIDDFCNAQSAEAHTETKEAADVGEEVDGGVELGPLMAHEV